MAWLFYKEIQFSFFVINLKKHFCLIQGAMLLMMGTAEELPQEPVQKTVFMEDMTEQQLASAVSLLCNIQVYHFNKRYIMIFRYLFLFKSVLSNLIKIFLDACFIIIAPIGKHI